MRSFSRLVSRSVSRPSGVAAGAFLVAALAIAFASAQVERPEGPGGVSSDRAEDSLDDAHFFEQRVAPLLATRCAECHGADVRRPKGGLRLDGRASLLAGGVEGPAIDLERPEQSLLLRAVRGEELGLEMPPDEDLSPEEISVLTEWITRGAPWPDGAREPEVSAEDARFFEERIRPVLAENCFGCHGAELTEVEGGLRMAGRAGLLRGGNNGPALIAFDPEQSLLVRAVRYGDRHLRMPPSGPLSADIVDDLVRWVAAGAPWPDYDGPALADFADHGGIDVAAARERWPFTPVVRPEVPGSGSRALAPVDAFIAARLDDAGITPNAQAPWRDLVRRAFIDLHGLPPTFAELERWTADEREDRFERLVDELLASPRYGERFARVWLDLVRYAETNGYERDTPKPFAWRYRDWVVDAFNQDKPYDRFLLEQLAGDELEGAGEQELVATGFLRLGAWDDEPDDMVQAQHDERDDILRTVTEGMLGLTVGCARCHDHLFDPIPQEDYYALSAFFAGLVPFELPEFRPGSPVLRLADEGPDALARWDAARKAREKRLEFELQLAQRQQGRPNAPTPNTPRVSPRLLALEAIELETEYQGNLPWILAARESGAEPPETHFLVRGRPATPGHVVEPRFLSVLVPSDDAAVPAGWVPPGSGDASGRRLALGRWITSPDNPLTARVFVNRVWQHLFGVGLVETTNDFGAQGSGATHPELVDWLAAELVQGGYGIKRLVRTLMLSETYRRSSNTNVALALERDPANRLLWRQNLRRLTAEGVHDAMLAATGELVDGPPPRGSFFPDLGREVLAGMSRPGEGWGRSTPDEQRRRALYAYQKRGVQPAWIAVLDGANPSLPIGGRAQTTTATQALVLLNGEFTSRRAAAAVELALDRAAPDADAAIALLFERILGRRASDQERAAAAEYVAQQRTAFAELRPALRVRPALPHRVDMALHRLLDDADALHGPRIGWTPYLGRWGDVYNGTVAPDPDHGPILLRDRPPRAYDRMSAKLRLDVGCEQVGLVLRAALRGDDIDGIELRLDAARGLVSLFVRRPFGTRAVTQLEHALEPGRPIEVELRIDGDTITVALDGAPRPELSFSPQRPFEPGSFAIAVRGEGVVLDDLRLAMGPYEEVVEGDPVEDPLALALESFAQMLFNTNEFVYAD